jgi:hypothetical protein
MLKRRLLEIAVSLGFVGFGLALIKRSGTQGVVSLLPVLGVCATLVWFVVAGNLWWLPMPFSVAFGGTFLYQHKLYPHELALIICLFTLLPVIALRRKELPERGPLPFSVYALGALFILNWIISSYVSDKQDVGSLGSLSRPYLSGFWAVLFGILFYRYGLLRPRFLLGLLYAAYLIRALLAGLSYVFENLFVVPQVGFVFSSAILGVYDFRVAGIQTALMAFVFAKTAPNKAWRIVNYGILVLSGLAVILGGGRVSAAMIFSIPLIWCLIRRKFGTLASISVLGLSALITLNQNPDMLYKLPDPARRALSIFVTETSTKWLDWHTLNQASNYWHRYLAELGWQQWTESPQTVLIGNRVKPFDEAYEAFSASIELKAEIAAKLGAFEAGLWTVLVMMGALGALLYLRIFTFLLRQPLALLRNEGISSPAHALAFLAVIPALLWVLFCWTVGAFPSSELMMAFFARVACSDVAKPLPGKAPVDILALSDSTSPLRQTS